MAYMERFTKERSLSTHLESPEAELAILGGILLDNSALDRVSALVSPEDFHDLRHQLLFKQMMALGNDRAPLDPVTLANRCEQQGDLEAVGGVEYIGQLTNIATTAVNIEHHARLVHERAEIRRLIQTCEGLADRAKKGEYDNANDLFDEAQQSVFEIGQSRQAKTFTDMSTALNEVIDRVQTAYELKSTVTGVTTGFAQLDNYTAGFQPGDLIILAARPSMGKTALALNLACNAASSEKDSVAIFSLEMPTIQLATRMLACEARVESERMRTGQLIDGDIEKLLESTRRMVNWNIFIDDTPGITVMECRSKCRRLAITQQASAPLKLVIIDYLQLMKGPPQLRSHREQEISDISRSLKALAKELGVPIIALSQLNRSLESRPNKRPMMSDLRESGAIEQDADMILFVYRDEVYNENTEDKGVAELIIGKQRNGPIGTCRLKFFKQWTRFDNLVEEPAGY